MASAMLSGMFSDDVDVVATPYLYRGICHVVGHVSDDGDIVPTPMRRPFTSYFVNS